MIHTWTIQTVSTSQELTDAFSVRHQVFVIEQGVSAELERDQEDQNATHFVLYDQGVPSGAGRIRFIDTYAKVERVCILKRLRGTGAGTALMQAIQEEVRRHGVSKMRLNAQLQASDFYTQLNYQVCSDEFMDAGIPHVTMEKELN